MRSLSEAEKHWRQLDNFHSLTDLKIHVSSHKEPQLTAGLRSVCWKIFLLFKTLDRSSWPNHLKDSRKSYGSLRTRYLRAIHHPDEFESSVDPLSEHDESPWTALRADESLRAEIFQDVERCMPENVYFRQPATQNMMLDILFVWCKTHPDVGYRQGMHEILAPLLWAVERDAVDTASPGKTADGQALADMLDSAHTEHDTHTLFSLIMRTAKSFYAPAASASSPRDTPMLARSARIFEQYLPKADPELYAHLVKIEIVPQVFLLRWVRLLFGREFPLDSVFDMWDALFAIDSSLEIVDMISIAMLLRIRWELIAADTNEAFSLLLRYPEPTSPAFSFIKDALYLRDHLTPQGGAEIISRYGKPAPAIEAETAPSIRAVSPAPSFNSSRTRRSIGSPRAFVSQQSAGMEALLQGAAKNVMERGSQWGIGKAIRDAVGEVRKNVEAYQTGPSSGQSTPRSGGREFRKPGILSPTAVTRPTFDRTQSSSTMRRIEELERRNRNLSKMLETAVGDLWEYHRERNDEHHDKTNDADGKESIEALSVAIAKVQFVQVYLEDSTIPLPDEEATEPTATAQAVAALALAEPKLPDPPSKIINTPPALSSTGEQPPALSLNTKQSSPTRSPIPTSQPQARLQSPATLSPHSRPHLTSSNFSWMLGEDSPSSKFASNAAHSTFSSDEKRRIRGKGFLFGDEEEDDDEQGGREGRRGSAGTGGKGGRGASRKGKKEGAEVEEEVEIINLDNMGQRVVA